MVDDVVRAALFCLILGAGLALVSTPLVLTYRAIEWVFG